MVRIVKQVVPQRLQLDALELIRARVRVGARVRSGAGLELVAPVAVEVDAEAATSGVDADWLAGLAPEAVGLPRVDVAVRLRSRDVSNLHHEEGRPPNETSWRRRVRRESNRDKLDAH